MDLQSIWHPYTRRSDMESGTLPIITRGEGIYLYDSDGRRYIDAISSWWCCNLGHSHPRLIEAITKQTQELQHSILGNMTHPRAVELAVKLTGLFPQGDRRVLFASDGASAVEAALKIAVQYRHNIGHSKKTKFISLEQAYHGDTLGAVSVGYLPCFHKPFTSLLFSSYRAESPCCGTCIHGKDPDTCSLECFASMEKALEEHAQEIAGVIVEPLCQGAAGMRIYSQRYLKKLYDKCREKNVLLIVDEIAMGMGRTGRMFAFEHAGIDPDIVCMGKGLSGGYLPISATVVKHGIYETFTDKPEDRTFYHGHTFAGNPIAAAAALETLRIYEEEEVVGQAERLGKILSSEMSHLRGLPSVTDVRCLGMVGAVELGSRSGASSGNMPAHRIREELSARSILVRPLGNVVYLMLPLITPPEVLSDVVKALGEAIVAVVRE